MMEKSGFVLMMFWMLTHMDQVSSEIIFCIIKLTKIWTYEIDVLYHCSSNATKTSFVTNGRCRSKQWYIQTIKEILVSLKSQTWNIKQIYDINHHTKFLRINFSNSLCVAKMYLSADHSLS